MIAIITLGACARSQRPSIQRLAALPIENLSPDGGFDWRGRAAAGVVAYDLAGAKNIYARAVDSLSAAQSMQASRLLEGYVYERNGRITMRATLEDFKRTKVLESFEIDGAAATGVLPLANELARRLSPEARVFGTRNENAFRLYGQALEARDSQAAERALQAATEADGALPDPIDRANLEYVAATANGDRAARLQALEALSAATPANANVFAELGELRFAKREFGQAATEYQAATRLNPDAPELWNQLGYALARAQDLSGARKALARYESLEPDDVNALDSQGEVNYFLGDFKAAGGYFERAAAKNPSEFLKAAEARLMSGDLPGADALFAKHLNATNKNAAGYQLAQWEFLTGRRKAGTERMEELAPALRGDLQSLALSQLAVWKLEIGDRQAAADLANQAVARATSPQARAISDACRYIASANAATSGSKIVDGYAMLLAKKYREALPALEAVYAETAPSADGQARTLLAWAYVETGAISDAAKLLDIYPLPLSSGDPLFASLIFPRYLSLRGAVLRQQGKLDEAKKSDELYAKYAGDVQLTK